MMLNRQQFHPNNDLRKKIQDYSYGLRDIIGKGFSSVVYRGINQKTKEQVAIKVIDIKSIQGKPQKKMLQGEIDALKKLNHSNILKCHDIYSTANNCYIITQFCNEGDLQNLMKKRGKISEEEATPIIRDFIQGFIHVGESGFLHRDLKPANLLIKDKVTKIADFGFAKRAGSNPKQTINVGSPLYMSPEGLQTNTYTIKNDIWSLGVIIYEMLHGKAPWTCINQKQLITQINKNYISLLKSLSDDLKDFVRKCLTPDPNKRLNLKQFSSHPYVKRICQIPPLLRKLTSGNENIDNMRSQKALRPLPTEEDIQPILPPNNNSHKMITIHHNQRNRNSDMSPTQIQFYQHIQWMRFLFKLNQTFPKASQSGRSTLNLRFVITKQMLCQLHSLKKNINGQNVLIIEGWNQFKAKKQQMAKYSKMLEEYSNKYSKNSIQYQQWLEFVKKDKKMLNIADKNFERVQNLSILGLHLAVQQIKSVFKNFKQKTKSITQNDIPSPFKQQLLRVDFIISYYLLNCLLINNFNDMQSFSQNSKLRYINQYKATELKMSNVKQIQDKIRMLDIKF